MPIYEFKIPTLSLFSCQLGNKLPRRSFNEFRSASALTDVQIDSFKYLI